MKGVRDRGEAERETGKEGVEEDAIKEQDVKEWLEDSELKIGRQDMRPPPLHLSLSPKFSHICRYSALPCAKHK